MMHGYLPYPPPQAYHHQANAAPAHNPAQYVQHMPHGSMLAQQQQMAPQSSMVKENGYYKRYSDVKTLTRPTADSVPEPKKARYDNMNSSNTTKVVSLRNIPNDITDIQVVQIGLEFGDVVNILYIKAKGQALIEFQNLNEAVDMVQHFRNISEHSLLKNVEAAHSSYQHLTIDNNRAGATEKTIQLGKQLKESTKLGGERCVIKAAITSIAYPVCIDALYQVFSKYGHVLKIVLIQKNELGALIQMKDEMQVQQAIHNLNGRNMYNTYTGGCNILNLQISQHKSIEVKFNNSKTWDYTNPLLLMIEKNEGPNKNNMIAEHPLLPMPMNVATTSMNNLQQQQTQQSSMNNGVSNQGQNSMQYNTPSGSAYSMQLMDGRSCVVQVSNFPEQISTPDALFTLFGVYGDILKVKIMYNRRDNALMQFKTYEQALTAVSKLDKVKIWGKVMQVGLSKFPEIQIPIKNVNDGGLAKDYSNSPLHRFKKPGSKNFYNIFQPNQTLHLSNISPMTTQENIQELFIKHGSIVNFKWINKEGNKMALLEMSSIEESVLALIALHNFQLSGSYLRVNFAK